MGERDWSGIHRYIVHAKQALHAEDQGVGEAAVYAGPKEGNGDG